MNKSSFSCLCRTFLVIIFTLVLFSEVKAQLVKTEFVLHLEQLSKEEQEYLRFLQSELIETFNKFQWIEKAYNYSLPIRIEIYFSEYTRFVSFHKYKASVLIATKSGVQFRDSRWDFKYSRDNRLEIGKQDASFLYLLEFYIWICLGIELDRFSPLGGQQYYEKARLISENARFDINFVNGWDYRRNYITDFSLKKFETIRKASFHASAGIHYVNKGDFEKGRPHLLQACNHLLKGKPEMAELHLDNHIVRFVNIKELLVALEKTGSSDLIDKLSEWDDKNPDLYKD